MFDVPPLKRKFLPADFKPTSWEVIKPYADDLLNRPLETLEDYQRFLEDDSEFDCVISEEECWRYVRMTCHTANEQYKKEYEFYVENISPPLMAFAQEINKRIAESPFALRVGDQGFSLMLRGLTTSIKMFRPENIALKTEETHKESESGQLRGAMTVTLDGEEMTMQKANDRLFWNDRAKREEAWKAVRSRYYQDYPKLDVIFDELVKLRHQQAQNAEYENYRDYMFDAMRRYDYTPADCYMFHASIEKAVVPLVADLMANQKKQLGVDTLRPWDTAVDPLNRPPLKAFESANDLIAKGTQMMDNIDPMFGDLVRLMQKRNQLDLDSRPNKRPGGYNMGMPETQVPFMFANVTEKVDDMVTFVHEMGHAIHNIQMVPLRLHGYHNYPMEVAELASMSLELISHDQWHLLFPNEEDCRRAKREHIEGIVDFFPWMAQVDAFQHEIYVRPELTAEQRHDVFVGLQKRFVPSVVDWSGFEDWRRTNWHRQGHIFENPFYYVEYGMAQLGALQVWRNYTQDPKQAVRQYKEALALGYTKSVPEIYETAGIKFDFSEAMLTELMAFVQKQLSLL